MSLRTYTGGTAVKKRRVAMRIAHELSTKLARDGHRYVTDLISEQRSERTLGELFRALHMARSADWSDHHRKAQERFRDFWLDSFGADCPLYQITPAVVEELGNTLAVKAETRRKYMLYMTAAFRYARLKLKWIPEADDLSAVDLPKAGKPNEASTFQEVRAILPALEAISDEAGWFGHVLFQTGRRPITVRNLLTADVEIHEGFSVLRVREENEKSEKVGAAVVVGRAHDLTKALNDGKYMMATRSEYVLLGWLRKAEKAAGVPHVKGRGWYGLKRRYVGEARGTLGYDTQSGVNSATLEKHYLPDDLAPKIAVAERLSVSLSVSGDPTGGSENRVTR